MAANDDLWFPIRSAPKEHKVRLFCFPHAGGAASFFRDWPHVLPPSVSVYVMQPPGRENRLNEPPPKSMPELISALVPIITPHLDGPFALFGHSLGGKVSFELAHRLRAESMPQPKLLIVSASSGPRAPPDEEDEPPMHELPREKLLDELERLAGTPQAALEHRELMDTLLPTIRADFKMAATAIPVHNQALAIPITALGGTSDEDVSAEDLDAWAQETTGQFRRLLFPGGHFYINTARNDVLGVIAKELMTAVEA